jgi:hypothetical protein
MDEEMSIPQKIGATAAKHPVTAASIALAAVSLLGPGRTIRFALRGIALASLAVKMAEGSKKAGGSSGMEHEAYRPAPPETD